MATVDNPLLPVQVGRQRFAVFGKDIGWLSLMSDIVSTTTAVRDAHSVDERGEARGNAISRGGLAAVYGLFAAGGAAALIYEVMWMRGFRLVFGSSSQSAAVVLAAFFSGMALGNLLGARLANRPAPLRVYGILEILVGSSALLVGGFLWLYELVYPGTYDWLRTTPGVLTAGKLLLALLALLPPTIAMGATLPVLSQLVADRPELVARRTSWLYMLNIAGAVLGAFLAGFYLPMAAGVSRTVFIAVSINWSVGAAALLLSRYWRAMSGAQRPSELQSSNVSRPAGVLLAAAAVSGFGSLALEVISVRVLAQRSDGSVYSFALMLVIFLLCLALGAWVAGRWLDRRAPWRFLAWTQLAAAIGILISIALFQLLPFLAAISPGDTHPSRLAKTAVASLIILGPPVLLIGVVLPWTWKVASQDATGVGRSVGVLTGVNTVAAVCGSLIAGFVLLPWLGLGGSTLLVSALYAALAVVGFWRGGPGITRWLGIGASILVPILWYAGGLSHPIYQPLEPGERLVRYRDTADASIAVIERSDGHRVLKLNHQYTLGSSAAGDREIRQGRLPLMLHPKPRRVAFIGAATGITTCAALDFPVDRVAAIELVPGVADALPLFARWNGAFYDDPRVQLIVDDGRNYLLGTRETFDLIISDLFVPWHAGTGDLYTVEHFRRAKERLAPGGIFAQWLPAYQLTVEETRIIAASFAEAFPHVTMWRDEFRPRYPLVCLVGYRDELEMDADHIAESRRRLDESKLWHETWLSAPGGLELLFICGDGELRAWTRGAPLNTDEYPIIEYATPISFLQHRQEENVRPIQELLASFRPRRWCYAEQPTTGLSIDDVFRAADLMQDAMLAGMRNDFESETRALLTLGQYADKLPIVAMYLANAAGRYQARHMDERAEQLLAAVVRHPSAPAEALLAMAAVRSRAGDDQHAIELLERAVEVAPDSTAIRKQLVEVLAEQAQFDRAEPHLLKLLVATPNDPFLRLDLARSLDRQGKVEEARAQVDEFRTRWDGANGPAVWRYLRTLGLGKYIDAQQPQPPADADIDAQQPPAGETPAEATNAP
jgi:spermidine synthase